MFFVSVMFCDQMSYSWVSEMIPQHLRWFLYHFFCQYFAALIVTNIDLDMS